MYGNTDPQSASAPRLDVKLNPERGPDRRTLAIVEAVDSAVERLVDAVADAGETIRETIVEAVEGLVDAVADVEQAIRDTNDGDKQMATSRMRRGRAKPTAPRAGLVRSAARTRQNPKDRLDMKGRPNPRNSRPPMRRPRHPNNRRLATSRRHRPSNSHVNTSEQRRPFMYPRPIRTSWSMELGRAAGSTRASAYGRALKKAGYKSFEDIAKHKGETSAVADKIFGRIDHTRRNTLRRRARSLRSSTKLRAGT